MYATQWLGLVEDWNKDIKKLPFWYPTLAVFVPVILAVVLRRIIPKLMAWVYGIGAAPASSITLSKR
jgi:hypothetical protein